MMTMMSMLIPKPQPLIIQTAGSDMQLIRCNHREQAEEKVVVVMGATGTGKSRLSIDLATRFTGEIINSDKIQMHKGLEVVANKITDEETRGIPHHLMSILDDDDDFTAAEFCTIANAAITSISGRGKLPIIAGGSNSFIEALIDDEHSEFRSRYQCSFIWLDVSMPVLDSYLSYRVDKMVQREMIAEVAKFYVPNADYSKGIRRSIGVPEFDHYFRAINGLSIPDEETQERLLMEAIRNTKINTFRLACRQRDKIIRLMTLKGWNIHRIDATEVFKKLTKEGDKVWENIVLVPSTMIVSQFLQNESAAGVAMDTAVVRGAMVAAAATAVQ